jgi:hypothetical protein
MRLPGTVNVPTPDKAAQGRSPATATVLMEYSRDRTFTLSSLRNGLPPPSKERGGSGLLSTLTAWSAAPWLNWLGLGARLWTGDAPQPCDTARAVQCKNRDRRFLTQRYSAALGINVVVDVAHTHLKHPLPASIELVTRGDDWARWRRQSDFKPGQAKSY